MDGPIYHLERVVKVKTEDLEDFVGPLDLILHLLNKNKMEIKDIQISLILDQYLQWMSQRKELDLEVASEFVTMASHLVYIKTRMLLSIHDEEALSEMEQLIATLEAHQRNENYLKIREVVPPAGPAVQRGPRLPHQGSGGGPPGPDLPLCPPQGGPAAGDAGGAEPYRPQAAPADVRLSGHRGAGALSRGGKGGGADPAAAPPGSGPVPGPVPGQPEPFGGGGHLSGGAGAVQGPAAASGGDGGGLHRDLYRAGGGDRI